MRNSKLFYLGVLWLSLSLGLCLPAMAATLTVNTLTAAINTTDGRCSFYEAIDAIENNTPSSVADCGSAVDSANTIQLPAGTISISLTSPIILSDKSVRVLGTGSSVLMMDSSTSSNFFWFIDNNDDLTLQDLTLDTQVNNTQGFISIFSNTPTENPILRLDNVTIQNGVNSSNTMQTAVSTIANIGNPLQVFMQDVQITNNRKAINNSGGTISIDNSSFNDNKEGISVVNSGSVSITNSQLLNNIGNALYIGDATSISVGQSCIVGNSSGGMFAELTSTATISVDNNWWGRSDGPKPTGSGDTVSTNISVGTSLTTAPTGCPTLSFSCDEVTGITPAECVSLLDLYTSTNGEAWVNSEGWFDWNDACSWYGVTCSFGFVESLQLGSNGLTGALPSDLSAFTNLVTLDLSNNGISGTVDVLTTLDVVENIVLSSNFFDGNLPDLSSLPDLTDLDLANNMFNGTVTWLSSASGLMGLDLDYNALNLSDSATASVISSLNPSAALTQTLPATNLTVSEATIDSITLNWSPIDYDTDVGAYRIEFATSATGTYSAVGETADKTVSQFIVTGLAENTTYFFRVRTYTEQHGSQKSALLSEPSAVISATTASATVPTAETNPVSATPLDFGDTVLSTNSSAITVQVLSVGTQAFALTSNVTGTNASDFQVTVTPFAYTNPSTGTVTGDSYDVDVVCNPSALGTRVATLALTTTPDAGSFSYPLSCNGINSSNQAPTSITLSNNSTNAGVASGIVGSLTTTDPDVSDTHTYTIQFSDSPAFAINANNLTITSALSAGSYNVTIRSTDSGSLFVEQTFTIVVNQASQAPTSITLDNTSINAGVASGIVGSLTTTDPDVSDTHTYTIQLSDSPAFAINANNLIITSALTVGSYNVTIRSTDSSSLFIEQTFTILVNQASQAPTAISLSNNTVATSTQASTGTAIGQFSTTDADAGDSHVYDLISDASGLFQIQGSNLIVAVGQVLNTAGNYPITVRSTDSNSLFIEQTFTITAVTATNAPSAIALSNNTVATSTQASTGTPIGQFSTTDADIGDSHIYSIVNDASGLFQIQGNNLIVVVGQVLNTAGNYPITVRSTDNSSLFVEQTFTITAVTATSAPSGMALSNNIIATSTQASTGTPIGQFSTTDADVGDTHSYSIVSDASGLFQIQGNNLIVAVGKVLNTTGSYRITVRSTDNSSLFIERTFSIIAVIPNAAPTAISLSNTVVATSTKASTGTIIGQLSTTDVNTTDTHTYTLVGDASGLFQIQGNRLIVGIGQIVSVEGEYPITIRSTDSSNLFVEQAFTISTVTGDSAPSAIFLSNTAIEASAEASIGTVVSQLSTVDANSDDAHTYTLVSDASGLFQIQGDQLIVAVGQILSTVGDYPITIRSTDSTNLFIEQNFTIIATATDQAPLEIVLSANVVLVSNEANVGAVVGQLSTIDPTVGDTHQYTLLDDASGVFTLQDDMLQVLAGVILDTEGTRQITVRSTDSTGLFVDQDFTIVLRESVLVTTLSGEASTATASGAELSIDAPEAVTLTGFITPAAVDIGLSINPFAVLTWQPENDNLPPISVNFELPAITLQIQNEFVLYQGKLLGLTGEFTIGLGYRSPTEERAAETIIQLTVLSNRAPSNLILSANEVAEKSARGTLIGEFEAEDPDEGDSFWYGLTDDAGGRFYIAGKELRVGNGFLLNYANEESHDITVRAFDRFGQFTEQSFKINILSSSNAQQLQYLLLTKRQVKEGAPVGTVIGRFSTIGPDDADYQYELLEGSNDAFVIVGDLLLVANGQLLDYEIQDEHEIIVQVTDLKTGEQLSTNFTISVQNQPDVSGEFKLLAQGAQMPKLQLKWMADSEHIGQDAEMFIVLTNPSFSALYMLTPNGWQVWDGMLSNLASAAQVNLSAQNTLLLDVEAGLEEISFLSTGQLFFAYQLENGDLLHDIKGMPIIELSLETDEDDSEIANTTP